MLVTDAGIVMFFNFFKHQKASLLIVVTESGITIDSIVPSPSRKAYEEIVSIPFGMIISFSPFLRLTLYNFLLRISNSILYYFLSPFIYYKRYL